MRIIDRKTGKEVTEGQEPRLTPVVPPTHPPVDPPPKPDDK